MNLHPVDLVIIAVYLLAVAMIGVVVRKRATKKLDSFYLADRNVPWWMLGLSGCSSYIDIGGTMSMIGLIFYLGLKSMWATHIFWGWFMICVLHGLPGQVHPPLRRHDLRRVERDALRARRRTPRRPGSRRRSSSSS